MLADAVMDPGRLGELQRQHRAPLLAAGREGRQGASVRAHREVLAMGADKRRALPELLLSFGVEERPVGAFALLDRVTLDLRRVSDRENVGTAEARRDR